MTAPMQPKKSNTGLIVGVIVGVVLLICVGVVGATFAFGLWFTDRAQDALDEAVAPLVSAAPAQPNNGNGNGAAHIVRYEVEGSGEAFLNWGKGTGGQESKNTSLPFSVELTVNADHFGAIVNAIPRGKDTAIKSCRILVDGKEIKKVEAKNGFVTCTATYPVN
ncbi:MAG TPA: MmpS family transport accessory protein [Candidatus Limnocylindrales bacterium]|nr:MmpS family transport accessory protein [Candidatus Limnocylindrales bacterium]